MTDAEQILLNRVKLVGDGEWSLIGTPQELIDEINRLIVETEENGILKGLYQARYATEPGSEEEQRIDNQIAELSNLSKTIAQETRYGSEIFTTMEARPLSGGWMFDDKVGNLFRYRKWWEFWKPERIYLAQPKDNLNKERLGHD